MNRALAVLTLLALVAFTPAYAYPSYFADFWATSCTDQPNKAYGSHRGPITDRCVRGGIHSSNTNSTGAPWGARTREKGEGPM